MGRLSTPPPEPGGVPGRRPRSLPDEESQTRVVNRGRRLGPYRLVAPLGRGGMAEVYRAERPAALAGGGPTACVLKVLRPEKAGSPEFVQMFAAEIRLMRTLAHPNIVRTYEGGVIDGSLYLAMELCTGASLHELSKAVALEGLPFPAEVAVLIAHEIAQALAHVHGLLDQRGRRLGLVHRDVSPSNIMLLDSGMVKLLDFGVAKATWGQRPGAGPDAAGRRPEHTRVDTIKGKLRYMAPEQVLGRPLDGRTDLFALGVILWELLSGRSLFMRETPQETGALIIGGPPAPPLRTVRPDVSVALEAVVARMLERDPRRRFQNGLALAAELAPLMPPLPHAGGALALLMAALGQRLADVRTRSVTPLSATPVTPTTRTAADGPARPRRPATAQSPARPSAAGPPAARPAMPAPGSPPSPPGAGSPRGARAGALAWAPRPFPAPSAPEAGWARPAGLDRRTALAPRPRPGGTGFAARLFWILAAASVGFAGGALWHRSQSDGAEASLVNPGSRPGVAIERIVPRKATDARPPARRPVRRAPAAGE